MSRGITHCEIQLEELSNGDAQSNVIVEIRHSFKIGHKKVEALICETTEKSGSTIFMRSRLHFKKVSTISSGSHELDTAALEAVGMWRFSPAVDKATGQCINSYISLPVVFTLD